MRVNQLITRDEGITNPKRSVFGVTIALRWGDVCHPIGQGNWFKPPFFSNVMRFWCPIPLLPWISWNLWGWRGYIGAKVYGADAPEYSRWIPAWDVYAGSQAIHFSARFNISD